MNRDQLANELYGEADRAEFTLFSDWNTPPPARATAPLERGLTAGLVTLVCFIWPAVLLAAAAGLAILLWSGRPWSLLLYGAVALAAAAWNGRRYACRPRRDHSGWRAAT